MVVSPSVAADVLKVEFRKATIVAFRETTFQLSTTNGTLPKIKVEGILSQRQFVLLEKIREWSAVRRSSRINKQPLILALNQEHVYERLDLGTKLSREFEDWETECNEFLNKNLKDNFLAALKPEMNKLSAIENRELQGFDIRIPFRSFDFLVFLSNELGQGPFKTRSFGGSDSAADKRIDELVQEYIAVLCAEQPDGSAKSVFDSVQEQYDWEELKLKDFHPELIELLGEDTYRDMAMRYLNWQLNGIRTGYGRALSRDLTRFLGIQDEQIAKIEASILEAKELLNRQYEALQLEQFREYKRLLPRHSRQKFDDWLDSPPAFMLRYYQIRKIERNTE